MVSLLEKVRLGIIGRDAMARGPFGTRRIVYADYAASGRALEPIERFLQERVLPRYANTHTETSWTGQQTSAYREQARETIRRSVGASDQDAVIFAGSGSTGAIHKLVEALGLRIPCRLEDQYQLSRQIPPDQRPVVFVGPYEHHSNELPWRESIADVVEVNLDDSGRIDLGHLRSLLLQYLRRPMKIGSFSAASNVTGLLTDVDAIAELLHQHGAFAMFDYATAGPHLPVQMNPPQRPSAFKDAVFLSPHKFLGGPGSPGLLVAKRNLFCNRVPTVPGGGTVRFVSPGKHIYLSDIEHREEGGTPDILGSIRAALAFEVKDAVQGQIALIEQGYRRRAIERWSRVPGIKLLGNVDAPSLPVLSFQVLHRDKPLHYGFVSRLLSDLFGVQVRGGCSCAGPYAHRLLQMQDGGCRCLETWSSIKPGWTRVSMSWAMTPEEVEYVIDAVSLVGELGWRMLPAYCFDVDSGAWTVRKDNFDPSALPGTRQLLAPPSQDRCVAPSLAAALAMGREALERGAPERHVFCSVPEELRHAAWFWLPEQVEVAPAAITRAPAGQLPAPHRSRGHLEDYWPLYAAGAVVLAGAGALALKGRSIRG